MRYYTIADLHGRLDLLEKAFTLITEDMLKNMTSDGCEIITLGDYIDRGPMSKQVITTLIDKQDGSQLGSRLICLKGNHEDMAVQVMSNQVYKMIDWWDGNGGMATWKSYGKAFPDAVDTDHVKWMANLSLYYETEKQIFVHAGIPFSNAPLVKQNTERMLWMLYGKTDHGGWFGDQNAIPRITKHIVHGHHQFADGPHEWTHRTDLDTFAWNTGRLVVGVFDDTQSKALRYIEVLGDDFKDTRTTDKG